MEKATESRWYHVSQWRSSVPWSDCAFS